MIDFSKIKLVIWDLDDTFWKGTLSEGDIEPISSNISLVHELTNKGIVNSVCSKNDEGPVVDKLKELGVYEDFVFNSINWNPKGPRICETTKDMGLRPINVLFLDDNKVNLNEAKFYSKELMVAGPEIIPELISYCKGIPDKDKDHLRLKQYQVLFRKQQSKAEFSDNLAFLYSTNTKVQIKKDCKDNFERIHELILRTNQLNYTKVRSTKEELDSILNDVSYDCGYVTVSDKFGEYGICGFFALKNAKLLHFLFSCRTIGQGVEQYVYAKLNYPELNVIGEVITNVDKRKAPEWINQNIEETKTIKNRIRGKLVFKGGCDLRILSSFFSANQVIEEFTYVGLKRHNRIEHHNHSFNMLSFPFMNNEEKADMLSFVFNDEEMFTTSMYDKDVSLLFLSTLVESNYGVYLDKKTGKKLAFAEYTFPLNDEKNWEGYINGTIVNYQNTFDYELLRRFKERFVFLGRITPDEYKDNVERLMSLVSSNAKVCFLLGSEIPYSANTQLNYEDRHIYHKQINSVIRKLAAQNPRILIIDFNDYIKSQKDFYDNINHFQRHVYYEAAKKANEYINQILGEGLKERGFIYNLTEKIKSYFRTTDSKTAKYIYAALKKLAGRK